MAKTRRTAPPSTKASTRPGPPSPSTLNLRKDETKHAGYVIRYNVKDLDAMYLKLMIMAQKYMDEFNAMAKSGMYGRDYQNESGANVAQIKDNQCHNIVDYQSTKDQQMLIVFGTNGH